MRSHGRPMPHYHSPTLIKCNEFLFLIISNNSRYEFAWTQPAEGKISRHQIKGRNESENLLPPFQDPVTNLNPDYIQLFAIGLNNSFDSAKNKISLGAKLAHLNETMSKYYWGIIGGTTAEMQHLLNQVTCT